MILSGRNLTVFAGICVMIGAWPTGAAADSCAPNLQGVTGVSAVSSIALFGQDMGRAPSNTVLTNAGDAWDSTCQTAKNPKFQTEGVADMSVRVQFMSGTDAQNGLACEGECGCAFPMISEGTVVGGKIVLFSTEAKTGQPCNDTLNLQHELGHMLGLDDSNCSTRIMGNRDAKIQGTDCEAVDKNFLTQAEKDEIDADDPNSDGPCAV